MNQKYNLNEVFYSIQGEGFWTGYPAIFIRFGGCDLNCSFCYKKKKLTGNEKPEKFWYELVKYINQLTNQVAIGSDGEPFMNPGFIKKLSKCYKKEGLIVNVTSNGRPLMKMNDLELKKELKDITMISLSFDHEKVKNKKDLDNYIKLVKRIKKLTNCQVGCNLLINNNMFKSNGFPFYGLVDYLFKVAGVDRVFNLYPKNSYFVDIIPYKLIYEAISLKYNHFYVDDLSLCILKNQKYSKWSKSCHFAKDIISISETGAVCGCSFDNDKKALLQLEKPEDLLKLQDMKIEPRYSCPYLNEN